VQQQVITLFFASQVHLNMSDQRAVITDVTMAPLQEVVVCSDASADERVLQVSRAPPIFRKDGSIVERCLMIRIAHGSSVHRSTSRLSRSNMAPLCSDSSSVDSLSKTMRVAVDCDDDGGGSGKVNQDLFPSNPSSIGTPTTNIMHTKEEAPSVVLLLTLNGHPVIKPFLNIDHGSSIAFCTHRDPSDIANRDTRVVAWRPHDDGSFALWSSRSLPVPLEVVTLQHVGAGEGTRSCCHESDFCVARH